MTTAPPIEEQHAKEELLEAIRDAQAGAWPNISDLLMRMRLWLGDGPSAEEMNAGGNLNDPTGPPRLYRSEADATDELLMLMFPDLEADDLRTDGGSVNMPKVRALYAERRVDVAAD